jgi:aspartate aminotransferase-like enzyme
MTLHAFKANEEIEQRLNSDWTGRQHTFKVVAMLKSHDPILMTPGPVPVPPSVLHALSLPIEHHRTPGFQRCLEYVLDELPKAFATKSRAFLHVSTGSGGMESLLVNVLSPGEIVGSVVSGKFGERWADMAEAFGGKLERFEVPWGESVSVEKFESWLELLKRSGKLPQIVLSQACETSTGALHPIREMTMALRRVSPDTLFLVDAITALGALPLPMDNWDLDGVVGGSQKAFMLPTGLSFVSFSERAWTKIPSAKSPRFYFDIRDELEANRRGETNFSSAVPLVKALEIVLRNVREMGGWGAIHRRIATISRATRSSLESLGLPSFAQVPSPSLSAIVVPHGCDGQQWRAKLEKDHGLVLMGGQDKLKGKILRIGHMGYIKDEDVLQAIEVLAKTSGTKESQDPALLATALQHARDLLKNCPLPWTESFTHSLEPIPESK